MPDTASHLNFLHDLTWMHVVQVAAVLFCWFVLTRLVRFFVRRAAPDIEPEQRLRLLRWFPVGRLLIGIVAVAAIVSVLIEPNVEDIIALLATVSIALAFALKDYVQSVVAGIVTIVENTYQPGDWIEVDGVYGEVKSIGVRALRIKTIDETVVTIPHARLWAANVTNVTGGEHSMLCVTSFYVDADHDGAAVRQALIEVAEACSLRVPDTPVRIGIIEHPWGTQYKLKATVFESRDQYAMTNDMNIRGREKLRAMGVKFPQVTYAETRRR